MFLVETPTWVILFPFVLICVAAYFFVWIYRDTNDFKKSFKLYLPTGTIIALVFWFAGLPLVLGVFMVFAGFVILIFISNRFFYK